MLRRPYSTIYLSFPRRITRKLLKNSYYLDSNSLWEERMPRISSKNKRLQLEYDFIYEEYLFISNGRVISNGRA
jgi:hypothetical protein